MLGETQLSVTIRIEIYMYIHVAVMSLNSPLIRTDQLLADIDDMLADLSTHLDFMIPGSS